MHYIPSSVLGIQEMAAIIIFIITIQWKPSPVYLWSIYAICESINKRKEPYIEL